MGQVVGDSVTVVNTFEDLTLTGLLEFEFDTETTTVVDPGVELSGFPDNAPLYNIDIDETSLTMTLVDGSQASDFPMPADRFDRYCIDLDSSVFDSIISVTGDSDLVDGADVSLTGDGSLLITYGEGTIIDNGF